MSGDVGVTQSLKGLVAAQRRVLWLGILLPVAFAFDLN